MQRQKKSRKGDVVAQFNKDKLVKLIIEQMEGKISPHRFARLDKLLVENPEALTSYLDTIVIQVGLRDIFGKKSKTSDISAPLDVRD
jgi:hypothetical protein